MRFGVQRANRTKIFAYLTMTIYDPKKHEARLIAWYFQLKANPAEFRALFDESLRSLTALLPWAARQVKFMFEEDADGIWFAAWYSPEMGGLALGLWCREGKRQGKAFARALNRTFEGGLENAKVILAITVRRKMARIMGHCGFVKAGEIPHVFDGNGVLVYYMTRDTRGQIKFRHDQSIESLRSGSMELGHEVPEAGASDLQHAPGPDAAGVADGGRERGSAHDQSLGGRLARRFFNRNGKHAAGISAG